MVFYYVHISRVENVSEPLEIASTPVSAQVAEPSQDLSKPTSATATKRSTGSVKRLSAYFEALDKQQPGAEGRYSLVIYSYCSMQIAFKGQSFFLADKELFLWLMKSPKLLLITLGLQNRLLITLDLQNRLLITLGLQNRLLIALGLQNRLPLLINK